MHIGWYLLKILRRRYYWMIFKKKIWQQYIRSTQVNVSNMWFGSCDHDNPIERKSK
jgi:hypothetical protein